MANETLGASFSLDISELKAGITQANRLIRESESEFRAAAAGMDDWTTSQEGLEKRQESLNRQIDLQKGKIANLVKQRDLVIEQMKAEGKSAEEIERATDSLNAAITRESKQLDKLKGDLKKTEKALEELGDQSEETEKKVEDVGDAADDSGGKMKGLKGAAGVAVGAIAAVGAACVAAVGAFFGLAESTRESRNEMAKLETSFQTAGLSAENAENTFTELYGILGDEGAAVEASQQLAKISKDEKDLAANTRILTGVMAEYGNSIPLEGLAEGIAASSAMSSVQGVLADALEWQGVNLDDFNAKLAALSTEEERSALIQETLTGLYGESADAYMKNNEQIIKANEAQAKLNNALNELGAIAEPIMTTLKNLAADLLTTITPFVALMGEGLTGALNGTEGAADSLASGLSGILDSVVDMATDMLPFLVDTIIAIVPKILDSLLSKLPEILTALTNMVVAVVNGLSAMLPQIIATIMHVLPLLINSLVASIPQLLQAAVTLLMALVDAVPVIIEQLLVALPTIITTLITALVDSIPILLNAAIQLLTALVDAIPVIIDALIVALPTIIDALITGLLDALPLLLDAAVTLLFAIIDAIPTIVETLLSKMPQITEAIFSSLTKAIPKLLSTAKQLLGKIIEAVGNLIKELPGKMGQVITSIVNGLKKGISKIKTIGKDIIKGLWEGINDMVGWIGKKIKGFGENVLGGIKNFFGINSPSKVMADQVGKNLALGIGKGFTDNIGEVNKDIEGAFNIKAGQVRFAANGGTGGLASGSPGGVVVNQYNTYSQAHSRYEIWQSQQNTAAAVKLALIGG